MAVWYATTQATSVQRQVDRRRATVWFWRLLDEIARKPHVMTRERHVSLWLDDDDEGFVHEANANYDRFAGAEKDTISSARTIADRDRLDAVASPVTEHVNAAIAHMAEHQRSPVRGGRSRLFAVTTASFNSDGVDGQGQTSGVEFRESKARAILHVVSHFPETFEPGNDIRRLRSQPGPRGPHLQ